MALEVDSVALTKRLVKAGLGYSILTYVAIQQEIESGELVAHRIERPAIRSTVAITTLRDQPPSRFAEAWMAMMREKLQNFIAHATWRSDVAWLDDVGSERAR